MKKKCLYTLLLTICFAMSMLIFPVSAATDSGTFGDNMTWTYDSETATVTISGTGTLAGLITDSGQGYLKYNLDARHLVIAEGITEITQGSFSRAFYNLESIRIADSVETIGQMAFANNFEVTKLHLGKGVKTIEEGAFMTFEKLESLTLPEGLQSIGSEAFSLSGIRELVIPEGITVLESGSFRGSKNLTRILIPTSVKHIKDGAFRDCVSLKDVYYTGTQEQWNGITLEHSAGTVGDSTTGGNTPLLDATIYYEHIHKWDEGKVITASGCNKEGEKLCTCKECGVVETVKVAAQHTWDSGTKNADTTVTYKCVNCTATKTEGTPVTEPTGEPATQPTVPETQPTTEPENTQTVATVPTETQEPAATDPAAQPTEPAGGGEEQSATFPWVAVCIGAAALIAAIGVIVWLRVKKKP